VEDSVDELFESTASAIGSGGSDELYDAPHHTNAVSREILVSKTESNDVRAIETADMSGYCVNNCARISASGKKKIELRGMTYSIVPFNAFCVSLCTSKESGPAACTYWMRNAGVHIHAYKPTMTTTNTTLKTTCRRLRARRRLFFKGSRSFPWSTRFGRIAGVARTASSCSSRCSTRRLSTLRTGRDRGLGAGVVLRARTSLGRRANNPLAADRVCFRGEVGRAEGAGADGLGAGCGGAFFLGCMSQDFLSDIRD
jgi:hypothetical protein